MDQKRKEQLSQYFNIHKKPLQIDDITYNDLDMDYLFDKINTCHSSIGEEYLYALLRQPLFDEAALLERESAIEMYTKDESLKNSSIKVLDKLSKVKRISVFKYLELINNISKKSFFYINMAWMIIIIAILLLWVNTTLGLCAVIAVYFYNAVTYFKKRADIKPYLVCFSYLSKCIYYGKKLPEVDKNILNKLGSLQKYFILIGQMNGETVSGNNNPFDLILDIFRLGLHYDIIAFYRMVNKVKENKPDIDAFLAQIGEIDAYISIVNYRNNLAGYCIPKHIDEKSIHMENVKHPLIKNAVGNDLDTTKSVLLTGCNASGKSTFLRSVAINILLSQTLHTCTCDSYSAPISMVISSMSIKDDLMSAKSFYMSEVLSLKRIIDSLSLEKNILKVTFVDEVLRGTNTTERIAASTEILSYLSKEAISFAATHDIELTEYLKEEYDNYHFSEAFDNEDFSFDYKLKPGSANTRNAIRLLEIKGFPASIISGAINRANGFDIAKNL